MKPFIVVFTCDHCGYQSAPIRAVWLVRGVGDKVAIRCPSCDCLQVDDVAPMHFSRLMLAGALVVGEAELQVLREIEDLNPKE